MLENIRKNLPRYREATPKEWFIFRCIFGGGLSLFIWVLENTRSNYLDQGTIVECNENDYFSEKDNASVKLSNGSIVTIKIPICSLGASGSVYVIKYFHPSKSSRYMKR